MYAQMASRVLTSQEYVDKLVRADRTLAEKIKNRISDVAETLRSVTSKDIEVRKQLRRATKAQGLFERALGAGEASDTVSAFVLIGKTKDGVETYETTPETKKMSWKQRKEKYLDMITKEYKGRTAKFERNGHTYYAQFDRKNAGKAIYGDNRSTPDGKDAIINTGADGDVFELVENARYTGSKKNTKTNTSADYFDYFIKKVEIDGEIFDLIADVEKEYGKEDGYVYTLALREETEKGAPATDDIENGPLKGAGRASNISIPQNPKMSTPKSDFSMENVSEEADSSANVANQQASGDFSKLWEAAGITEPSADLVRSLNDLREMAAREGVEKKEIERTANAVAVSMAAQGVAREGESLEALEKRLKKEILAEVQKKTEPVKADTPTKRARSAEAEYKRAEYWKAKKKETDARVKVLSDLDFDLKKVVLWVGQQKREPGSVLSDFV